MSFFKKGQNSSYKLDAFWLFLVGLEVCRENCNTLRIRATYNFAAADKIILFWPGGANGGQLWPGDVDPKL